MTTINNSENLIEKVGGIEKAREIVEGAPTWATTYCMAYAAYGGTFHWYGACKNCYVLPALRTAIAEHDEDHCNHEWNDITSNGDKYRSLVCKHCDSTKNYLPLDEDHVTDIRNHLSPSTIVKDLEAERHG